MQKSEIRDATKAQLLDKVRKQSYGKYLLRANIGKIRGFAGQNIAFDFPVTALIGPNGSGKSSVLGVAGCAYKSVKPGSFFPKSAIGDNAMAGWRVEYDLIDKQINATALTKRIIDFRRAKWIRGDVADRSVVFFGIERTVPAGEKTRYKKLMRSTYVHKEKLNILDAQVATQVEHILGKAVGDFQVTKFGSDGTFFIGKSGTNEYSEFHFGAGESSIIRMVSQIELAEPNSLILIEEIENGLHPVATRRMVEYLIDVAGRKSIQVVFTTHSDYALSPLPTEAIWASIDGKLKQGRLSVEALRAVSGRVDKKLAVFVEDEFAKNWVDSIFREKLGADYEQLEVHAVAGDGNAVSTHLNHMKNPAIKFKSLCVLDGDSLQTDDENAGIFRLPGRQPELEVFTAIHGDLAQDAAILTVSLQRAPEFQQDVVAAMTEIIRTNRDPHLLFNQLGIRIGFVPEPIVRGAFFALWIRKNETYSKKLAEYARSRIQES